MTAITGFPYASEESLDNLHLLDWEIRRIKNLRQSGPVSRNDLLPDVNALLGEIYLALQLKGLKNDERQALERVNAELRALLHEIERDGTPEGES